MKTKTTMKPVLLCVLSCSLYTPGVYADTEGVSAGTKREAIQQPRLEEVIVIGTRTATAPLRVPQAVSLLRREQILDGSYRTTPEALAYQPGIHLQKTAHGQGSPFIRGLTGKQVLIMVDGVRLNNSAYRFGPNQYLATVDLNTVERIEVLRGPASALFGSDALGGVINVITDVDPASTGTAIRTTFGSADNERSVAFNTRQSWRDWHLSVGASSNQYAALEAGGDIGTQHHTGYDEQAWFANLQRSTAGDGRIGLRLQHNNQYDVPRTDKYVNDQERYLFTDQSRTAVTAWWRQPIAMRFADTVEFNLQAQKQQEHFMRQNYNSDSIRRVEDAVETLGFTSQASKRSADHRLIYGAEYYRDEVDAQGWRRSPTATINTGGSFPDASKYHSSAAFAEYQLTLPNATEVSLGLRYSHFKAEATLADFGRLEETYDNATASIRISSRLSDTVRVFGGIASGFRAPNLDDLVVLRTTNEGIDVPSPNLDPEQAWNYEIGLKQNTGRWQSTLVAFYADFDQLIERRPGTYQGRTYFDENGNSVRDPGEEDVVQKYNLGKAHIYGLEFDAQLQLAPTWTLSTNIAYLYGKNESGAEPLSRIPPLRTSIRLRKASADNRLWGEVLVDSADRQDRLSARDGADPRIPTDGTPGYISVSLLGGWQINNHNRLIWAINNLTDQKYKMHGSGLYEPGASAKLTYILNLD